MKRELTLPAMVENIETVTDFVNEYLNEIGCSVKIQMKFGIVIDEIFSNIANYAYDSVKGKATVGIDYEEQSRSVVISFTDDGKPYDPLSFEEPDTTLSVEDRKIGGMGIFIVKRIMDDISYKYVDGKNILTVRKML